MCVCGKLTYCLGNIVYILERLASCFAATSVVTCIVTTLLIMLALGVGLGYNYCYVDMQTGRYKDDDLLSTLKPVESHVTTSKKGIIVVRPTAKTVTPFPIEISPTMVAPLFIGINFTHLIQKIKERRENVTLELVV